VSKQGDGGLKTKLGWIQQTQAELLAKINLQGSSSPESGPVRHNQEESVQPDQVAPPPNFLRQV